MDKNYTLKKRLFDILITVFIVLLISSLFFGDKTTAVADISSQISNFEENISSGNVITDGIISSDFSFEYQENKVSNFNAKIGETIYKIINGGLNFFLKILKKLIN